MARVLRQGERRQARRGELEAVRFKTQLAHQRRGHEMQQMRAGGNAEPGRELARDGRAPHPLGGLEHQHRAPGAREIGGAHQAVVAAADHDAVVARVCRRVH